MAHYFYKQLTEHNQDVLRKMLRSWHSTLSFDGKKNVSANDMIVMEEGIAELLIQVKDQCSNKNLGDVMSRSQPRRTN